MSQAALLAFLDIGLPAKVRITQVTYDICRDRGWMVDIEPHPYHQITPLGQFAIGHGPDPDDPTDTRTVEQCRVAAMAGRTHDELTDALSVAEVAIARAVQAARGLRAQNVLSDHEASEMVERLSDALGVLHGAQAVADEAITGRAVRS